MSTLEPKCPSMTPGEAPLRSSRTCRPATSSRRGEDRRRLLGAVAGAGEHAVAGSPTAPSSGCALDRLARHDARLRLLRDTRPARPGTFVRRIPGKLSSGAVRIFLDGPALVVWPRAVAACRIGIVEQEPALVAVQFAQPPLAAVVAVRRGPLDAEHLAGVGIDDDAAPVFVDVDLDVAGLREEQRLRRRRRRGRASGTALSGPVEAAASSSRKPGEQCRNE